MKGRHTYSQGPIGKQRQNLGELTRPERRPPTTGRILPNRSHLLSEKNKGYRDVNLSWEKKNLQDYDRAIHTITRLYDFNMDKNNDVYSVLQAVINKGKRKRKLFRKKTKIQVWGENFPKHKRSPQV